MEDTELLKITFARLGWSFSDAGRILNIPKGTIAGYSTGRATIPARVWLAILEHEARIFERQKEINSRAAATQQPTEGAKPVKFSENTPRSAKRAQGVQNTEKA